MDKSIESLRGEKFVASYSGGKDCLLAIDRAVRGGMQPLSLITTYNTDKNRSWFHGVPPKILDAVAQSLGCPVVLIRTSGKEYAKNFEAELARQKKAGAAACVFGDIDLEEHRKWCTARCEAVGLKALFPLWEESRESLVYEEIDRGFLPRITVVDTKRLSSRHLGKILDKEEAQSIRDEGADICGENGEYHTFVTDGPLFSSPIRVSFGEPLEENGYAILPMLEERDA